MVDIKYPKGSEWRRWDLHVHTTASYDYEYNGADADELLCSALNDNGVVAVAITDHFVINKDKIDNIRSLAPNITFFPGVELRTDKGDTNIHVILIFDDNEDNLNFFELVEDFNVFKRTKAQNPTDNNKIYWDYKDIIEFADAHKALISIHAGRKSEGIDRNITSRLEINQAVKEEYSSSVNLYEMGQLRDLDDYREKVFPTIGERPMIICSDCHNPKAYSSKEFLWIKADPTFEGLKQCLYQPSERVYVGTIPTTLDREQRYKRTNIANISSHKTDMPKHPHCDWFDFSLPLNAGLVAIIGNKGSGKSALSDIIAHMCDCSTMKHASFLHDDRFRKSPNNYANDYEACIAWGDDLNKEKSLAQTDYGVGLEYAQYLPQKYIEYICNDMDNAFQSAIDKVIFSYVDESERGSARNLSELVDYKSASVKSNIDRLKDEISTINECIIDLEKRKTTAHRNHVNNNISKLKEDLQRHDNSKPLEISKPEPKETDNDYQVKLIVITESISNFEARITTLKSELTLLNEQIDNINNLLERVNSLHRDIANMNLEIIELSNKYNLQGISSFSEETPSISISLALNKVKEEKKKMLLELNGNDDLLDNAESTVGLVKLLKNAEKEKETLILSADMGEKIYQKYLSDLKAWETERLSILGNDTTDGSLLFFETELQFINESVDDEYSKLLNKREEKATELFNEKLKIVSVHDDIYAPISNEIKILLGESEEDISFVAELQLNKEPSLVKTLLDFIDKSLKGKYKGTTLATSQMDREIKSTVFSDIKSILSFAKSVMEVITEDFDTSSKKVSDKLNFYNLLYSMDYVDIAFRLKVGERSLDELSPGERGIVLLVFFLALSKENTPIIIDQPEDNLDNQSVYDKLVPCICAAKKKRQVIIVTHNPNIAIACDAEQIVCCSIDKSNNSIRYDSGAIEDEEIKKRVIDVLEGTMPAFDLRKRKYVNMK